MPETAAWDEHRELWQDVMNARPVPSRGAQRDLDRPVQVRVRIEWQHDGQEIRETTAVAWAGRDVLVEVNDIRVQVRWVWVDASHVERI